MFAVDPDWYPAHDAPGKQLTILVELLGVGRTLANVATPASPTAELLLRSVQAGSIGQVTNTLDPWSGVSQIGQVQIQVANHTGFARTLGPTFRKSAVRILLGIGGLPALADFLPVFYGHVEQSDATGPVCTITLVPGAFAWHRDLSVLLGDVFFTGTDDTQTNQAIPLLVGRNVDVETIPITAVVSGSLAQAVSPTDTALWIREFGARFPQAGTVILGEEAETLTYTQRQIVDTQTGSLLVLSGLSRSSPVAHSVGDVVAVDLTTWHYLIGWQCTVLAVRRAGRLLAPTAYTVEEIAVPGTLPATVLTFTQSQAGTVLTVDVDGSNIAPGLAPIVNGGFETGDTTGWTVTDATALVTTGETPDFSPYKCELTGGYLSDGVIEQTFPLTVGQGYVLAVPFLVQPTTVDTPVVNGRFETGDTTGWTVTLTASHPELNIEVLFGTAQTPSFPGVQIGPDRDGEIWAAFRDGTFTYQAVWEQVCTVAASTVYRYAFSWLLLRINPTPGLPPEAQVTSFSQIRLDLLDEPTQTPLVVAGRACLGLLDRETVRDTFTTLSPTLRIRITAYGEGLRYPPLRARHGGIVLAQDVDTSWPTGHLTLGPPTQPTALLDQPLQAGSGVWETSGGTFIATADQARLALTTQYDQAGLPASLWLDAIRLAEAGRHPVDVLRWLIETFLPGLAINDASFQAAYLARAAWRCGGQWRDPGDSRALLTHLADQFELRYFENGTGEACLVPIATLTTAQSAYQAAFTSTNARAWTTAGEPPTQLATDIYVYYNARRGAGGQTPADYGAVVYATPETTTGALAWQVACYQVATVHGIRQTLRYFAEAIQDQLTAHLKLAALVERYTTLGQLVTCEVPSLRLAPLEIGDTVVLQHALLGDIPQVGEVLGVAVDLGTPALTVTVRVIEPLGSEEGWEFPTFTIGDGTEEDWEI